MSGCERRQPSWWQSKEGRQGKTRVGMGLMNQKPDFHWHEEVVARNGGGTTERQKFGRYDRFDPSDAEMTVGAIRIGQVIDGRMRPPRRIVPNPALKSHLDIHRYARRPKLDDVVEWGWDAEEFSYELDSVRCRWTLAGPHWLAALSAACFALLALPLQHVKELRSLRHGGKGKVVPTHVPIPGSDRDYFPGMFVESTISEFPSLALMKTDAAPGDTQPADPGALPRTISRRNEKLKRALTAAPFSHRIYNPTKLAEGDFAVHAQVGRRPPTLRWPHSAVARSPSLSGGMTCVCVCVCVCSA